MYLRRVYTSKKKQTFNDVLARKLFLLDFLFFLFTITCKTTKIFIKKYMMRLIK